MAPVASVKKIADQMDGLPSEATAYLNLQTGEVFAVTEIEESILERADDGEELLDWESETLPLIREVLENDDWLALPDRRDVHDWSIMRDFCYSITDADRQEELLSAIHGSQAFGRFRDIVYRQGLEEQWFRFKAEAIEQVVVQWLEAHEIPYIHDDRSTAAE